MQNFRFNQLPGELRNAIYSNVFDGTIDVHIDSNEKADDAVQHALALLGTCKQICAEAKTMISAVQNITLYPAMAATTYGKKITGPSFDISTWFDDNRKYASLHNSQIVLHVGEIDIAGKRQEFDDACTRFIKDFVAMIPTQAVARGDIVFAIQMKLVCNLLPSRKVVIPVPTFVGARTDEAAAALKGSIRGAMVKHRRGLRGLMINEWVVLSMEEVSKRRGDVYYMLYRAQLTLGYAKGHLYDVVYVKMSPYKP